MKGRIAFGFAVAVALLAILVHVVGGRQFLEAVSTIDRQVLALGVLSGVLSLTFRGVVWQQFISLIDDVMPRQRIATVFLTAMFVKYVTPYGQLASEPFVAYLVSQGGEMAFEDGLASILSADLLNYVPYYTFGFLAVGMIAAGGTLGSGMFNQLVAFAGLFLVLVSVVFVVVRRPGIVYSVVLTVTGTIRGFVGRFTDRFDDPLAPDTVHSRLEGFYTTIETIAADKSVLIVAVVSAHLGMVFLMLPVYIGGMALGYQLAIPVVVLVVALGKLGSVVPAPGGTGGVEAIVTAGLTALAGIEPAAALTIALIYRACTYWLTIGIGGLSAAGLFASEPTT
ncbi:lysylphosphatidylglycerol synthase transmembrane domain-containing protein [Natronobacterium texcoconense]|uniref:Lysylphosphatidylglycerol synthase TM region n=1 Tax=Natronobacterium texcoconense TaxID=1095778 RepID=A0A1H1EY67_NATTX|nr:lysylphosphatidylglycerol synthase transmembrane domain-containing protein [Natronobacterium texcoconense]SDQ93086.1 hypothetical protein SAMN04489842_1727 [Natronobacterium texcoconense]